MNQVAKQTVQGVLKLVAGKLFHATLFTYRFIQFQNIPLVTT